MKIYYTDRAISDIDTAIHWYELQQRGLGIKFLDEIENSIDNIKNFPNMYKTEYQKFRKCILTTFPFSIYYTLEKDIIIIHAIFHHLLDPSKKPSNI
ncbi:MAG: type II toxin-antitoxin system RelE/ParE family toxin [Fidelibacterota bacterium]